MTTRLERRWLALILGIALGIRLALAVVHGFWFPDSADYHNLAKSLVETGTYQSPAPTAPPPLAGLPNLVAVRMPGYPLFIAAVYKMFGVPRGDPPVPGQAALLVVLALQAMMEAGSVWLTYRLGRRFSPTVGLIAAALVTFDPLTVAFGASFLSEAGFTFLLLAALVLASRPASWIAWIALGLLWGLAVYFRASALWCIVPVVLWMALTDNRGIVRKKLIGAGIAVIIVWLMLSPWLMRNYSIFHSGFFRMTTLEGISLYEAVYPDADGGPKQDKISLPPAMVRLNEAQRNDEWAHRGWAFVRDDPGRILKLAVIKIGRTWSPVLNAAEFRSPVIMRGLAAWSIPLFTLAIAGLVGFWRNRMLVLLLIPVVYFTAVHALFLGSVRYRVPLMPIVCLLAARGAVILWQRIRGGQRLDGTGV